MSDDIVERLRSSARPEYATTIIVSDALLEAADVIERLRSIIRKQMEPTEISRRLAECNELSDAYAEQCVEIKQLRAALQRIVDDGKNCADYCRRQARRALEPMP